MTDKYGEGTKRLVMRAGGDVFERIYVICVREVVNKVTLGPHG